MKRLVRYFASYGAKNTNGVIEAVAERLEEGEIKTVVVASSSGETAIKLAEKVRDRAKRIICVSDPPWGRERFPESPGISLENRAKLEALGVEIIDYMPYASVAYSWQASGNVYGVLDLLVMASDAFRMVGGNGLKVAIEVGLMATNAGKDAPGEEIIAAGGTGGGADTAIVMKAAFSCVIFSKEPEKRPEVRET
ncbi:MAG: hypothetical protein NUW06_07915 [Candidatus Acetothermia bacterium]|jgi:hypothetical protein|nr:hypothetical protein [Candidatus Acetothermia bacterium]MDH7505960.1 pyruvate kinase alpha/beta domain-containing protein [Candidatus Acetothermia bacterium]